MPPLHQFLDDYRNAVGHPLTIITTQHAIATAALERLTQDDGARRPREDTVHIITDPIFQLAGARLTQVHLLGPLQPAAVHEWLAQRVDSGHIKHVIYGL